MNEQATAAPKGAAVPLKLSWAQFADAGCVVAQKNGEPSVVRGLMELGPKYSLVNDDDLDSLGLGEMIMGLEEGLQIRLKSPKFEIPDELEDKAQDFGEAYTVICAKNHITPDFSDTPDLSSFKPWLEEEEAKAAARKADKKAKTSA